MGKLNKKLLQNQPKIASQPLEAGSKVKGPFPIYRSTTVQLNGPEPKSFKIIDRQQRKKDAPKRVVAPSEAQVQKNTVKSEDEDGVKVKKLRKLAISRLSKKEKKQFRKDEMLKKIELTKDAFKQDKERKKREKTSITGDLRPLLDALPSLDSLFEIKSSKSKLKTGVPKYDKKAEPKTKKARKALRMKQRKQEFLTRCTTIKRVLGDKTFRKDPKKAIADHIKNTRKEQLALLLGTASS